MAFLVLYVTQRPSRSEINIIFKQLFKSIFWYNRNPAGVVSKKQYRNPDCLATARAWFINCLAYPFLWNSGKVPKSSIREPVCGHKYKVMNKTGLPWVCRLKWCNGSPRFNAFLWLSTYKWFISMSGILGLKAPIKGIIHSSNRWSVHWMVLLPPPWSPLGASHLCWIYGKK